VKNITRSEPLPMSKLIIILIAVSTIFLLLFAGAQIGIFSLSDPTNTTGVLLPINRSVSLGNTDGVIILAGLAYLLILIPIIFHFRFVKSSNKK
jgi:hypothetical protein